MRSGLECGRSVLEVAGKNLKPQTGNSRTINNAGALLPQDVTEHMVDNNARGSACLYASDLDPVVMAGSSYNGTNEMDWWGNRRFTSSFFPCCSFLFCLPLSFSRLSLS